MKKIFIVTGELSGDRTAAWYLEKLKKIEPDIYCMAVGGDHLANAGAEIFARFEQLNITGAVELIKHIPRMLRFLNALAHYIKGQQCDEVILVDFPGFNLRLAKKLKTLCPSVKITYLAPPQLWCWGAWRIRKIKHFFDRLIVLYPFEVAWYKARGVDAQWLGSPVLESLISFFPATEYKKTNIALMPGSRNSELEVLLPIVAPAVKTLHIRYPEIRFIIPVAASLSQKFLSEQLTRAGFDDLRDCVELVYEHEKYEKLASCCMAISKPGTVTLELALLKIPTVIIYKTSSITYMLAKMLAQISYMGLPNLLLPEVIFPEYIQSKCKPNIIAAQISTWYQHFSTGNHLYNELVEKTQKIRDLLRV